MRKPADPPQGRLIDRKEGRGDGIEEVPQEVRSVKQKGVHISQYSAQPEEAKQFPGIFIQEVISREKGEQRLFTRAKGVENMPYLFIIFEGQSLPEYFDRFRPSLFPEIYLAEMQIVHGVSGILGDCLAAKGDALLHLSALDSETEAEI
jgi:hypothetical protein